MIVELRNDDDSRTTYVGVQDFHQHDVQDTRITELYLNSSVEADFDDRKFIHNESEVVSTIAEKTNDAQEAFEHIGDRLVESDHKIVVAIPSMTAAATHALAELREDSTIDAEDALTIVGQPDPEFPSNNTDKASS